MVFLLSSQNVIKYLLDIGVCNHSEAAAACLEWQKSGNNLHFMVSFPGNRKLLVKQAHPIYKHHTKDEFYKEQQFYKLLQHFPALSHMTAFTSTVIHIDERNEIIVYHYLSEYVDLGSFYHQQQYFPGVHSSELNTNIASVLGQALARLHRTTIDRKEYNDLLTELPEGQFSYEYDNPAQGLGRLTPEIFGVVPAEALKFFVLYQRYDSLTAAIADLANYWYPCCLTHNNLRFDNILVKTDPAQLSDQQQNYHMVRLIDWERCGWGDPVFDLGNLLASYLDIWLSSLIVDSTLEVEESLSLAITPLEEIQPAILALIKAYLQEFSGILECRNNFIIRVIQSTGLALIDRIAVMIQEQKYFDHNGLCILKVAKTLLCRPQSSLLTIFGINNVDFLDLKHHTDNVVYLSNKLKLKN